MRQRRASISTKMAYMQRYLMLGFGGLLLAAAAIGQSSAISVQGGVNRPSSFSLEPSKATLSAAIRRAGGLIPGGSAKAVIYRLDDHGVPHEIPVALQPILDHKAEDVPLKPGDVVYVPSPLTKPPGQPVIDDRL
jgi:protein involved in polysaccharide export with SLBB domain